MIPDGSSKILVNSLNDAILQYINYARTIATNRFEKLTPDDNVKDRAFYFVLENGLRDLREGSEAKSVELYNIYMKSIDDQIQPMQLYSLIQVGTITLAILIMIRLVFTVRRTAHKVISLFGYIPNEETEHLIEKCRAYSRKFLGYKRKDTFKKDGTKTSGKIELNNVGAENPRRCKFNDLCLGI
jgi:hypothetical protein